MKRYLTLFISILVLLIPVFPVCAAVRTQLNTPEPYVEGTSTAAWERVANAASYDLKVTMKSTATGKSVSRTFTTTLNRVDLSLFAAGNDVNFSVRANPSASSSSRYRTSAWGECDEEIGAVTDGSVTGFAGISSGRFYMEDENGSRITGWQKSGGSWYYFDPADSGLAATGWAGINGKIYLFSDAGKMCTGWQVWNSHWYYLDATGGHMYTGWHQITPNNFYYFTENATAEQPYGSLDEAVTTASYPDSKPPYPISRITGGNASAGTGSSGDAGQSSTGTETAAQTNQWKQNPDGSWSYLKNGTALKNSWEKIDGFWYYFNSKGIMLTGWQFIGNRWYYLEPAANGTGGYKQGAMWADAVTPDGYQVNADGCWVQNGSVVTTAAAAATGTGAAGGNTSAGSTTGGGASSGTGSTAKQTVQITNCRVNLSIGEAAAGQCRTATVTGATYSTVKSVSYSKPQENWNPGETVTITVELEAAEGYIFSSKTKFSCSSATLLTRSGTSVTQTAKFTYTPVMKLDVPTAVYINDSYELRWAPPAYACRYRLVFSGGEAGTKTVYVTEPRTDLYEYGDINKETVSVAITALGEEGSKCYLESDRVTVNDLGTYRQGNTLNGTFERQGQKLRYLQEDGTCAKGWKFLLGNWYHFKQSGLSDGPGWYQDTTGHWYYFDSGCRMVIGTVTENGKTWLLNDGRRSDLPVGAWIQ